MTRYTKSNGKYSISGTKFEQLTGSRAQVWHGTSYKTTGGLTKKKLMKNKAGRIVSKAKFATAKKENRLVKYGYGTQKGKFGFVSLKKSRKHKGGSPYGNNYSPSALNAMGNGIDGQGITSYPKSQGSVALQLTAGQAGGNYHNKGMMMGQPNNPEIAALNAAGGGKRRGKKGKRGGKYNYSFNNQFKSLPGTYNNPEIAALNAA